MSVNFNELEENIYHALDTKNSNLARQCAAQLKDMDDDEQAERLLKAAMRWDDEDNDQA